jgi:hypothetical protein
MAEQKENAMNPRIKPIKIKVLAAIIIDAFLLLLLVLVSYTFFSTPAKAENVNCLGCTSEQSPILAPKTSVDGTTLLEINYSEGKVFVCKYVGTPGVDERLQTGDNPISVSISAIPDYNGIGSWFADEQGRSYVLAEDVGQPEPPVTDCPPVGAPTPTIPPTATPTLLPPPTATPSPTTTTIPSETNTPEPSLTNTVKPSETNTPEPSLTNTVKPSATSSPTLQIPTNTPKPSSTSTPKPTNTRTSTIEPSPTPSPTNTRTPTATTAVEVLTCQSCYIVKDFREMIVSGLYTADLLNTEDVSTTIKVSITLYDVYKGVVIGQTIDMVDTQPANEVMQVQTPLWCIKPDTSEVYWIHAEVSAQKTTGEIWFVLDEWVRINPTDVMKN